MKRVNLVLAVAAGVLVGRLPLPVTKAEDPPPAEVHTCPFCTQEVEIPDTPAGAFMKVKIGVATENMDLLRENLLGFDGTAARDAGAAYRTLTAQLVKVDVSGDAAILVLAIGTGMVDLPAVRDGGRWKVDVRAYRNQQMAASGRTALADLHARVRRFVETSGHVPRSGEALWSDLKSAGLLELRLLNTPRDAARVSQAEFDASDWSRASFQITADPLSRDLPPGKPVAWEKAPHDGKRLVLYASGVVVELDQASFDAAIDKYEGK